jgi:hypothetical protein
MPWRMVVNALCFFFLLPVCLCLRHRAENSHSTNTVFLVGTLMSVVGGVFILFALMALCYRSVVVHKNFSLCLRLVFHTPPPGRFSHCHLFMIYFLFFFFLLLFYYFFVSFNPFQFHSFSLLLLPRRPSVFKVKLSTSQSLSSSSNLTLHSCNF